MPTILSFLSGRQITNASGVPQSGAKLYHYRANTTTALTVWQDADASVQHAQPVECDAGGFVPLIYVDETFDWKVLVATAGDVTLHTYDDLPAAVADESAVGFAPPLLEWTQVTSSASPVALTAADVGKAYEADTTGGSIEFDLPDAAAAGSGKGFVFKKTSASNTMTLDPNGSQTIDDGSASLAISAKDTVVGIFSNGAEWYRVFGHLGGPMNVQVFTGSDTYTPTAEMRQCIVISTGAGGGGGGTDSPDGSSDNAGGGGGSGATCIELFTAAQIGTSQTVTIGAGGTAGSNTGGNGGTGGDTTFGSLHTAGGGSGGTGSNASDTDNLAPGGAGGTATGGLINIPGAPGGAGISITGASIVGSISGYGGASFWGGGGGTLTRGGDSANGTAGAAFGSGGSGSINSDETGGNTGGAGAAGICVVIEFF